MKKIFSLVLVLCLCAGFAFAGGSQSGGSAAGGSKFTSSNPIYAGYDLNSPVKLYMYMLGDPQKDFDEIFGIANKNYFQPMLNAEIEMIWLSWSDYATKEPLILAGGEDVDIMFTAPWALYDQEAAKGSFVELTMDFVQKWMPQSYKMQSKISWQQAQTNGKVFAVPTLGGYTQGWAVVVRDDLRQKYNLPELNSVANFEKFITTIAGQEKEVLAMGDSPARIYSREANIMGYDIFGWINQNRTDPKPEDIVVSATADWNLDIHLKMVELADKGVWSRNILNQSISHGDLFLQGKTALVFWNSTIFRLAYTIEEDGIGKAGLYEPVPNYPSASETYNNNMWAIASSSKYPERAAMVIDLMKMNTDLVNLLKLGVEGRHYTNNHDGTFTKGLETLDYAPNAWAWALNTPTMLSEAFDKVRWAQRATIENNWNNNLWEPKITGFRFDKSKVENEYAVITALNTEYDKSFSLGIFGKDTKAKFDEFKAKMKAAGEDKVLAEFRSQYAAYLASN
jgi:ABC-type glycerol-3-phosphate transport system substrate-binding protein